MLCYDKYGQPISFNDYVEVETDIGTHKGYVNFISKDRVRVNCLPGEFRVKPDKITLIKKC